MNRHPFIAIEGLDGTGKTTLRKGLFRLWQGLFDVAPLCLLTTNFLSAEHAGQIVEGKYQPSADNRAAYLSAIIADKNETLQRLVRPQRRARPVIADRWLLSDLAFFAVKHDARPQDVYGTLAEGLVDGPDATLLLELSPNDSMRRARSRTGDAVREGWDVHDVQSGIRDAHAEVISSSGSFPLLGTVVRLDATGTPAEVLHSAWTSLEGLGLIPGSSADLEGES
ncbi:thymidylate kinase [Actinomadura harenae]|uniref:Thymidylate kinase n=2 Tax=Actinomadura harenae TaxID=2483351 RepID=A0A3M2LJ94_9ACTN|nr:thymidylate kinase [Actinomadura harenae]